MHYQHVQKAVTVLGQITVPIEDLAILENDRDELRWNIEGEISSLGPSYERLSDATTQLFEHINEQIRLAPPDRLDDKRAARGIQLLRQVFEEAAAMKIAILNLQRERIRDANERGDG